MDFRLRGEVLTTAKSGVGMAEQISVIGNGKDKGFFLCGARSLDSAAILAKARTEASLGMTVVVRSS